MSNVLDLQKLWMLDFRPPQLYNLLVSYYLPDKMVPSITLFNEHLCYQTAHKIALP